MQFVGAVQAKLALLARARHPLDASPVAELPCILDIRVDSDDFASALVACDAARVVLHLDAEGRPFVVQK